MNGAAAARHACFVWWVLGDTNLSPKAKAAIGSPRNEVMVSAASAWEISTKHRLGKWSDVAVIAADVHGCVAQQGFTELPISVKHGQVAGAFTLAHADPFDRMLAAQAMLESMTLVSNDHAFAKFPLIPLW